MFIIYGTRKLKKILGEQQHLFQCQNCNNLIHYKLMSLWTWFTLFWIPIFPVGRKKYYSICPVCERGYEHSKEEMDTILFQHEGAVEAADIVTELNQIDDNEMPVIDTEENR